jgi:hypothetical protein
MMSSPAQRERWIRGFKPARRRGISKSVSFSMNTKTQTLSPLLRNGASPASRRGNMEQNPLPHATDFKIFGSLSLNSSSIWLSLMISGGESAIVSPLMRIIVPWSWKAFSIAL